MHIIGCKVIRWQIGMYRFIFHYIYLRAVHERYVSIDPRTILLVLEFFFLWLVV